MLKAFIDDSGSGGDSTWVVLAGYIASAETWDAFQGQWLDVLREAPYIETFHSSEAESLRPDGLWSGISKEERDWKIDRLIDVIHKCQLQPVSVRMRQSNYDAVMKGNAPKIWDNPYYVLFNLLVNQLSVLVPDRFPDSGRLQIVFDNHEKYRKTAKIL